LFDVWGKKKHKKTEKAFFFFLKARSFHVHGPSLHSLSLSIR